MLLSFVLCRVGGRWVGGGSCRMESSEEWVVEGGEAGEG